MTSEAADNAGAKDNQPRVLGLALVPGKHIVSIETDRVKF